jgi:hypothetical protein
VALVLEVEAMEEEMQNAALHSPFSPQLFYTDTKRNIKRNFMCAENLCPGPGNSPRSPSLQVSIVIIRTSPQVNVHIEHLHDAG